MQDLNDDGLADLVLGSADEANGAGAAYVLFGKASSAPVDVSQLGSGGYRLGGAADQRAGYSVALADDVDGDSRGEVIIGAPGAARQGRPTSGAVFVAFGKADTSTVSLDSLGPRGITVAGAPGDKLGTAVASAEDLDRDGIGDLAIGGGQATVVRPRPGQNTIDLANEFRGFQVATGPDGLIADVTSAADANGDGFPDIVVADPDVENGRIGLVYGKLDSLPLDLQALSGQLGRRMDGDAAQDRSGTSVAVVEDADGTLDTNLVVGSPMAAPSGRTGAGIVHLAPGPDIPKCYEEFPPGAEVYDANGDDKIAFTCGSLDSLYLVDERSGTSVRQASASPEAQAAREKDGSVQSTGFQWQYEGDREYYG